MRNSKKLAALCAFFAVAVVVAGCGSSLGSGAVANVAGNAISTRAFDHWMYVDAKDESLQSPGEPVIVPTDPPGFANCIKQIREDVSSLKSASSKELQSDCKEIFTEYKNTVLTFLIEGYWYQGDLSKLGLSITDAQVDKKLAQAAKKQFPTKADLTKYLSETGETEADLHWEVRVNLAYQRLIKHFTKKVTTAAVDAYYAKNKARFAVAETRDVYLVEAKSNADAQAAYAALKGGASWASVAKKYSINSTSKTNGGLLTGVTSTTEENAISKVIFSSPVGQLEGPVKGIFGYYVIQVKSITPGKVTPLATASKEIKELLTEQYTTAAETTVTKISKQNYFKSTICRTNFTVADCHNYKAPKTTSTSASSGSTSSSGSTTASSGSTTASSGSATTTTTK